MIQDNKNILTIKNLSKTYKSNGIRANIDINLDVRKGEILGLLGPNGAGKTTMVRQICGLIKPDKGEILYGDIDLVKNPKLVPIILSSLSQVMYAHRALKVKEFILFTGIYRGMKKQQAIEQMDYFIDYFNIKNKCNQLMSELSGGETRLVGFIAALMGLKKLIILDEPTNDMDPEKRILLWNLVRKLNDEYGISFILVTHNIHEAQDVVDRVSIIKDGRILITDKPENIIKKFSDNVKIKFSLPYNVNFNASIKEDINVLQVDKEHYLIDTTYKNLNDCMHKLFLWEKHYLIKNIEIITPSLSDAYMLTVENKEVHDNES
ncbi:ABC transporter ATP-binding protein [Lutispora thermophila]|nr:ABC transporter ATP-binding protein [Lutispora thermophila]